MNNDLDILKTVLTAWTDNQLDEANSMMKIEARRRRENRTTVNKVSMQAGDIVIFDGVKSGACTAEIVRVKTKKAIVRDTTTGMRWDVPLGMLRKKH